MTDAPDLPDVTAQTVPPLVALADVLALIDAAAAEPGTYPDRGVNRQKVWLVEPSLSRLKARLAALPQHVATAPALVQGLDAQGWYDTARRYHAGLRTIAFTWGHGIDHQWARDQARWYLGDQAGRQAWAMPNAPDLVQIVVPREGPPEARITPMPPLATLKPGETLTATLEVPSADAG